MTKAHLLGIVTCVLLGWPGIGSRAQAQVLSDWWADAACQSCAPPATHTGTGGSVHEDKVIELRRMNLRATCQSPSTTPAIVVAARTWVDSASGGGWALTILKYHYETGQLLEPPFVWPASPSSTNYFVPTAMEAFQDQCGNGEPDGTTDAARILVTGYTRATSFGNTDYLTVCWNGSLGIPEWSKKYSRPGAILTFPGLVDEEPVDIDCQLGMSYHKVMEPGRIVAVTGHSSSGSSWDIHTVFYDAKYGEEMDVKVETAGAGNQYKACGVKLHMDGDGVYPNCRAHVVGTLSVGGQSWTEINAFSYPASQTNPGTWWQFTPVVLRTGAHLQANAMTSFFHAPTDIEYVFVAGRSAGVDESQMLLAKLSFVQSVPSWHTLFSPTSLPGTPRVGEAFALDYLHVDGGTSLIALGGTTYRSSAHGLDSIACLYDDGSSAPSLRWSAWQNRLDTAFPLADAVRSVRIGYSATTVGRWLVYVAGEVATSAADLDIRGVVFDSNATTPPSDPDAKLSFGNTIECGGSVVGGDSPRTFLLDPYWPGTLPAHHNIVLVGNAWNGAATGSDILTRRLRFVEP